MKNEAIAQLQLPDLADTDEHPRLTLNGEGIHAGDSFAALFPDGWHDVTLEIREDQNGPGCWYISTPGFREVCPVGLFVKIYIKSNDYLKKSPVYGHFRKTAA